MVKYKQNDLNDTFSALADPTRRAILARLAQHGEALVTELAEPFDMSLAAVSKHLDVLERAGLLTRIKDGRNRTCRLNAKPLQQAQAWFHDYEQFWSATLARLDKFLSKQ